MQQIDAALEVGVVSGHVLQADFVVDAHSGAADRRDDVIAGGKFADMRADSFHAAKTFVPEDQKFIAGRRSAVFGGVDFLVGAVHADARQFHEHAAPVRNLVELRLGHFPQMNAIGLARYHGNCFHANLLAR